MEETPQNILQSNEMKPKEEEIFKEVKKEIIENKVENETEEVFGEEQDAEDILG